MKLSLILLLLLLPFLPSAQHSDLSEELIKTIQDRIDNGIYTSIAIGVIDKSGTRYYSFGAKKTGGQMVNEHTIYEIGSISKVFTAILLAEEIVQEHMKADDPISGYLPSSVIVPTYKGGGPDITLGHLSDHTSSLPRLPSNLNPADQENPYADFTVEMLYDFLSNYDLPREVGSEFEYSNLAVGLLGHILALKAGTSYEELLKARITLPLDMQETGITLNNKMKSNLATGYANGKPVKNWDLPAFDGAGAIRSSVADMLLFLAANMKLSKSNLNKAMELSHQPRHDKAGDRRFGLGWMLEEGSEETIYTHGGATGGYRAYAAFVKKGDKGVVVLTNSDIGVSDIGRYLLDPTTPLEEIRPSITVKLQEIIESEGADNLFEEYLKLKKEGRYGIDEGNINTLGYYYLTRNNVPAALKIFEINIDAFPEAFNVYDSYGEGLMKSEQNEEAIENYKKSLELNPANVNAVEVLARLGVEVEMAQIEVDEAILDTYLGTYQLAPGFNIVITREGKQLIGQATGQPSFELFAKTETEFYLKVVVAQAVFGKDEQGLMMMTFYQNGQVLPGKKLE